MCGGVHAHVYVHASGSQRLMVGILLGHFTLSFIYLSLCVCVWACMCYGTHVEARGLLCGVSSLLLPFHGVEALKSGGQAWEACAFTH